MEFAEGEDMQRMIDHLTIHRNPTKMEISGMPEPICLEERVMNEFAIIQVEVLDDLKALGMTDEEAKELSGGALLKAKTLPTFERGSGTMLGYEWQGHQIAIAILWADTYMSWLSLDHLKIQDAIRKVMGGFQREPSQRKEVRDGQWRVFPN